MGHSTTPTYYLLLNNHQVLGWSKNAGRATAKNLAAWAAKFAESMLPGGCNEHLAGCPDLKPRTAQIIRNDGSQQVVATWTATN